MSDLYHLQIRF